MATISECVLRLKQGARNHEIGYVDVLGFRGCPDQTILTRGYANLNPFSSDLGWGWHLVSGPILRASSPYTHCTPEFWHNHITTILHACFQCLGKVDKKTSAGKTTKHRAGKGHREIEGQTLFFFGKEEAGEDIRIISGVKKQHFWL